MFLHGLSIGSFVIRQSEAFIIRLFVEVGCFLDDRLKVFVFFVLTLELSLNVVNPFLFD